MAQLAPYGIDNGNVLAFEEINKMSRDIRIRTKDIVQELGYELVYEILC
jgi:hypothetical protein